MSAGGSASSRLNTSRPSLRCSSALAARRRAEAREGRAALFGLVRRAGGGGLRHQRPALRCAKAGRRRHACNTQQSIPPAGRRQRRCLTVWRRLALDCRHVPDRQTGELWGGRGASGRRRGASGLSGLRGHAQGGGALPCGRRLVEHQLAAKLEEEPAVCLGRGRLGALGRRQEGCIRGGPLLRRQAGERILLRRQPLSFSVCACTWVLVGGPARAC